MSLEDRLRRHFQQAAQGLPEPPDRLDAVVHSARRRRAVQRGAALAAAAVVVVAVPLVLGALPRATVELEPGAPAGTGQDQPPAVTPPSPPPSPGPEPVPDPTPAIPGEEPTGDPGDFAEPPPPARSPGQLETAVLAYGPAAPLRRVSRVGEQRLWPDPVATAFPDGQGGVVLQPAAEAAVVWLPDGEAAGAVTLAEAGQALLLRGLLADGRALYSVRPPEGEITEGDREEFFAVALEQGAQPEQVGARTAYESWHAGPVEAADGEPVHAACHLHCSLWPGLADAADGAERLYQGLSIEGLSATPDGRVLAFVEFDVTQPDLAPPELVLLDGTSFEVLARVELPGVPGLRPGNPQVSLSADGQRALVALGTGAPPGMPPPVPEVPYLVHGALTGEPEVERVDGSGVLRWVDPVEASGQGGPVSAGERAVAEALIAFAGDPGPGALAELPLPATVGLGLGPELLGEFAREELADPQAWSLEPAEGSFRAYVGPFSVLDVLAGAGEVSVRGGPHAHCAGPPVPAPGGLEGARRVSIQPDGVDSCLSWFTVDLFLSDGEVAAVTLDLYEP